VQQIYDRVAGLDVHRDSVVACFRRLGPRGGVVFEKERFGTTTAKLRELGGVAGRAGGGVGGDGGHRRVLEAGLLRA
jgi:hypothetical protein